MPEKKKTTNTAVTRQELVDTLCYAQKEIKRLHKLNEMMLKRGEEVLLENETLKAAFATSQEKLVQTTYEHSDEFRQMAKKIDDLLTELKKKPTV